MSVWCQWNKEKDIFQHLSSLFWTSLRSFYLIHCDEDSKGNEKDEKEEKEEDETSAGVDATAAAGDT